MPPTLSTTETNKKLLWRRKGVNESFLSRQPRRKSFLQSIPGSLAKPVKNYHGIIVHQRSIDPRQMVLLRVRYAELKKGTSAVLLQSGLDEKWWADSMEC